MAYCLSLSLTEAFAQDWARFKAFALDATHEDAGATAAHHRLGLDLGGYVRLFLEQPEGADWGPLPARWESMREREAPAKAFSVAC